MYRWLYRNVVKRNRWINMFCWILIELWMINLLLTETAYLLIYHYCWYHWKLKRKDGSCWICDSYADEKLTDIWLDKNYGEALKKR